MSRWVRSPPGGAGREAFRAGGTAAASPSGTQPPASQRAGRPGGRTVARVPRLTRAGCLRRTPEPKAPRWPRDAAAGNRREDTEGPLPSGAQTPPRALPTRGMGGGGSALRVCADHRGGINWLSLSPDGQRLLTGSEDGTARLWSTADGTCCALLQGRPFRPRPPTARPALLSAARQPLTCPQTPSPKSSAHPPWTLVEKPPGAG